MTSKHSNSSSQQVEEPQYRLSFTSGGLLVREAGIAASLYQTLKDWSEVRASLKAENLLQARTVSSGQRVAREVVQRLSELADDEVVFLIDATSTEQGYLMWAATCRRYSLLGEFAAEVVRERFLILAPTVDHSDFDSFVRMKTVWHEELADLKESTYRKLRANVFLMLREAGLLGDSWSINPAMLTERLTEVFANGPASDVRFFPTNEPLHSRGGQ